MSVNERGKRVVPDLYVSLFLQYFFYILASSIKIKLRSFMLCLLENQFQSDDIVAWSEGAQYIHVSFFVNWCTCIRFTQQHIKTVCYVYAEMLALGLDNDSTTSMYTI